MQGAQGIPQPLDASPKGEDGRCLLPRDNHGKERELQQTQHVPVQLEVRSLDNIGLFFTMELLLDRSKGPESCEQDNLPSKGHEGC